MREFSFLFFLYLEKKVIVQKGPVLQEPVTQVKISHKQKDFIWVNSGGLTEEPLVKRKALEDVLGGCITATETAESTRAIRKS